LHRVHLEDVVRVKELGLGGAHRASFRSVVS